MWKHESKSEVLHGYEGQECLECSTKQYYQLLYFACIALRNCSFLSVKFFMTDPQKEPAVCG